MPEPGERARTPLTAPRVEFDLSALGLGVLGYLLYHAGWLGLAAALGVEAGGARVSGSPAALLRQDFFATILEIFGRLPYLGELFEVLGPAGGTVVLDLPLWKHALVALWLLLLWSIVGGALARVYAVRIARGESISWDAALGFSLRNLRAFVQAPLFVLAAGLFFLALDGLAGAAAAVPFAGPVLQVALQPLSLLAGLIVTVIALGGVFGLPLMNGAIAAERNGTLDAVSRCFSYAFTRPVLYAAGGVIVLFFAGVIHLFGHWFVDVASGTFVLGAEWQPEVARSIEAGYEAARDLVRPRSAEGLRAFPLWVSWFWSVGAFLAVRGFVISYAMGGLTDLYFMLRHAVDGTDDAEVFVDGGPAAAFGEPLANEPADPPGASPPSR